MQHSWCYILAEQQGAFVNSFIVFTNIPPSHQMLWGLIRRFQLGNVMRWGPAGLRPHFFLWKLCIGTQTLVVSSKDKTEKKIRYGILFFSNCYLHANIARVYVRIFRFSFCFSCPSTSFCRITLICAFVAFCESALYKCA